MKKIIFLIIIATSLISCVEVLDISLEDSEKLLVLNGIIEPDSIVKVNLSKSINATDGDAFIKFIKGADVELYADSEFVEKLQYDTNGYYIGQTKPVLGKTYTVKVKYEDKPQLQAATTIPQAVQLKNISYDIPIDSTTQTWTDPETGDQFDTTIYTIGDQGHIYLTIADPENQNNYYLISATYNEPQYVYDDYGNQYITGYIERSFYISINGSDNAEISDNFYYFSGTPKLDGTVFSDFMFNGYDKELVLEFNTWQLGGYYYYDDYGNPIGEPSDANTIYLHLFTISKEMFDFIVSYNKYERVNGNPFAEPVNIFSNVENGIGLLGGVNCVTDTVKFY